MRRDDHFADAGATNITAGTPPYTGTYQPEGTLTASGAPLTITANITTMAGFIGFGRRIPCSSSQS